MSKHSKLVHLVSKFDGEVTDGKSRDDYMQAKFLTESEARGFIYEAKDLSFVEDAQMDNIAVGGYYVIVYKTKRGSPWT